MKVVLLVMAFAFGGETSDVKMLVDHPPTLDLCEEMREAIPGEVGAKEDKTLYKLFSKCFIQEEQQLIVPSTEIRI